MYLRWDLGSVNSYGRRKTKRERRLGNPRFGRPVILSEILESVVALVSAAKSIERNALVLVIVVADRESAVVFPRKEVLETLWNGPTGSIDGVADMRRIQGDILRGVTELLEVAAKKAETNMDPVNRQASIATELSRFGSSPTSTVIERERIEFIATASKSLFRSLFWIFVDYEYSGASLSLAAIALLDAKR